MGRGVFCIRTPEDLSAYLSQPGPAYIQEYLPIERDIRVIVIGREIALAYWREARHGEFRTNVARGASIRFGGIPDRALNLALDTALRCGWDDVGLDILEHQGKHYVIEANMKYGRRGFAEAGIDYTALLEEKLLKGLI
jgi:ribosomal protein S6--L-glutamate ligase